MDNGIGNAVATAVTGVIMDAARLSEALSILNDVGKGKNIMIVKSMYESWMVTDPQMKMRRTFPSFYPAFVYFVDVLMGKADPPEAAVSVPKKHQS